MTELPTIDLVSLARVSGGQDTTDQSEQTGSEWPELKWKDPESLHLEPEYAPQVIPESGDRLKQLQDQVDRKGQSPESSTRIVPGPKYGVTIKERF